MAYRSPRGKHPPIAEINYTYIPLVVCSCIFHVNWNDEIDSNKEEIHQRKSGTSCSNLNKKCRIFV